MSITTEILAGDRIVFTGYKHACEYIVNHPPQGARGTVTQVVNGAVVVDWDEPVKPLVSRVLLAGEFEIVLHSAPVIAPTRSVTLSAQQVGRATRKGPFGTRGVSPRAPWWQRLLNPDRWYWAPLAMLAGAMLGIYAGVVITEMGRV